MWQMKVVQGFLNKLDLQQNVALQLFWLTRRERERESVREGLDDEEKDGNAEESKSAKRKLRKKASEKLKLILRRIFTKSSQKMLCTVEPRYSTFKERG